MYNFRASFLYDVLKQGGIRLNRGGIMQKMYSTMANALAAHIPYAVNMYDPVLLKRSGEPTNVIKKKISRKNK